MKTFPDNSIDTIITDPPYGLGFMGKEWDKLDKKQNTQINGIYDFTFTWSKEALRVAKYGATLLSFGGTRTWHRMACGIEDAGWVIKDTIMWVYGQGFPKGVDISKQLDKQDKKEREIVGVRTDGKATNSGSGCYQMNDGKGSYMKKIFNETKPATKMSERWNGWKSHALKPAFEPIIMAMKPNEGSYAENAIKWGVSGLNIDGGRIGYSSEDIGKGWSKSGADGTKGYCGTNTFKIRKRSAEEIQQNMMKGRYPANLILECICDEILEERCVGKSIIHTNPNCPCYIMDQQSGKTEGGDWDKTKVSGYGKFGGGKSEYSGVGEYDGFGGASRFFYVAKASKSERNRGCEKLEKKQTNDGRNELPDTPHQIGKTFRTNDHPTVKPLKLMEYLSTLTKTPFGGIILDPFAGSGTTCMAAKKVGRYYIGIEKDPEYIRIAEARIKATPHDNTKLTDFEI